MTRDGTSPDHDREQPDPRDPEQDEVEELDPDAPGRWLFEDADEADAPEPNEPG